jgi:hypothetical protein
MLARLAHYADHRDVWADAHSDHVLRDLLAQANARIEAVGDDESTRVRKCSRQELAQTTKLAAVHHDASSRSSPSCPAAAPRLVASARRPFAQVNIDATDTAVIYRGSGRVGRV